MLIVCPSCASRYELDAAKLGPTGRKVRCASCQTLWHVEPAEIFPEAPSAEDTQALLNEELQRAAEIEEQITAVTAEQDAEQAAEQAVDAAANEGQDKGEDETVRQALRRRDSLAKGRRDASKRQITRGVALPAALALGGLVVIGALVAQRNLVVRAAPQLAAVFETLGLPVNVRGLSLSSVESGIVNDGQGRFLVVEGDVTNITRSVAPVPPIEVAIKDASGQTLYTWTTEPPRARLEPAELLRFRARLAAPPDAGKSVHVRFGDGKAAELARAN